MTLLFDSEMSGGSQNCMSPGQRAKFQVIFELIQSTLSQFEKYEKTYLGCYQEPRVLIL